MKSVRLITHRTLRNVIQVSKYICCYQFQHTLSTFHQKNTLPCNRQFDPILNVIKQNNVLNTLYAIEVVSMVCFWIKHIIRKSVLVCFFATRVSIVLDIYLNKHSLLQTTLFMFVNVTRCLSASYLEVGRLHEETHLGQPQIDARTQSALGKYTICKQKPRSKT